ncbi:uncharacterized protein LOC123528926 [Mercenaria mercenaria]|uniref:uncharacterized protein LOC123528926 n=1 Tax=Mercenaria mercenaria TaxID=6596 RepID=UPI00234E408B|nr:uncharacterized protein LOC123528926 [Mercenaria mercenaria]XP_053377466.1 uncharacterized protein LOC123528926 [Mercenaria mercenaria]
MKACLRVNSTLADMHSIRNISRIVVELGLRRRANLKNWIKGTRQRKERLLQLNGQSQFAFVSGALSLKHLAICERNINTKKLSTILQSLSPTTGTSAKRPTPSAMPILSVTPAKSMSSSYVSSKTSKNGTLSTMTISSENTSLSTSQRGALPIPSIMSMTSTTSAKSVLSANASLSKPQRESTSARSTINSLVSNALALISNPPGNTVPGATGSKRSDSWIKIDAHECYVNHDVNNYTSAEKYCKRTLNASLMTFVSSIQYFQVLSQLNLSDGSYWIGANNNNNIYKPIECLSYHRYSNTMSISNCTRGMFSVCSRYINNVTEILESAAFRLLLKDMTVNKTDTSVNKRKRISMNTDHRWSVQAAGGISLFVICLTVTLPLMIDFTRLARYRKKRL